MYNVVQVRFYIKEDHMVDKYMYVLYMFSSKNKGIIIIEPGFNCWTSVTQAFQSWFAVEYSSCFICDESRFICSLFRFIDLVEVLHADRTTYMCIWNTTEPRARLLQRKTGLSPPVIYYWLSQGDASVVDYSNCQCSFAFCSIYLG